MKETKAKMRKGRGWKLETEAGTQYPLDFLNGYFPVQCPPLRVPNLEIIWLLQTLQNFCLSDLDKFLVSLGLNNGPAQDQLEQA